MIKIGKYYLVHQDRVELWKRQEDVFMRTARARDWFSGWKDLKILFDYLFFRDTYFGSIDSCRDDYARARKTTVYGEPL